jgi:hypothetical protein
VCVCMCVCVCVLQEEATEATVTAANSSKQQQTATSTDSGKQQASRVQQEAVASNIRQVHKGSRKSSHQPASANINQHQQWE